MFCTENKKTLEFLPKHIIYLRSDPAKYTVRPRYNDIFNFYASVYQYIYV